MNFVSRMEALASISLLCEKGTFELTEGCEEPKA